MADDQEQRTFEVIKLRVAFLQHITTLSGAAILIVLALIERAETAEEAYLLATAAVSLFLVAAVISLYGVFSLTEQTEHVGQARPSAGRVTAGFASATFAAGIAAVAFSAAVGSVQSCIKVIYTGGAVLAALAWGLILLRWLLRRYLG
jgi:hypothetical protein